MKESAVCIHISPPSWISGPLTSIPPLEVITEHWTELAVLYNSFPLAIYATHGSVYMSTLLSHHPLYPQVHSTSVSLFLTSNRFIWTIFPRFCIYAYIYHIWFSLSDLFTLCDKLKPCRTVRPQSETFTFRNADPSRASPTVYARWSSCSPADTPNGDFLIS